MNSGRGRPRGENKSVISVSMLRTILFPKQSVIGCEVAVCHIHCSIRIFVDGCNNFSILSNHPRFSFYASICSLPGFSHMCLVYHCSSTIMYQQYRIPCRLQSVLILSSSLIDLDVMLPPMRLVIQDRISTSESVSESHSDSLSDSSSDLRSDSLSDSLSSDDVR